MSWQIAAVIIAAIFAVARVVRTLILASASLSPPEIDIQVDGKKLGQVHAIREDEPK
jgi:hypothetical protein